MFLLAEVLRAEVLLAGVLLFGFLLVVEEETVLVVSGLLEEKGMTGGGEGVAVLWLFACNLVLLEPFLFG